LDKRLLRTVLMRSLNYYFGGYIFASLLFTEVICSISKASTITSTCSSPLSRIHTSRKSPSTFNAIRSPPLQTSGRHGAKLWVPKSRFRSSKKNDGDWESLPKSKPLPPGAARPKLIVFDLDNTCWTPELYQLPRMPKPGKDIRLFPGAKGALHELATSEEWQGTRVAAASRTHQTNWAKKLISKFEVAPDMTMEDLFSFQEIYPGTKRKHFQRLRKDSGVSFDEMIFFDDSTWNTNEIEQMGVLCVFCPRGLTTGIWELGINEYAQMKMKKTKFMGRTISTSKMRRRARN